MNEELISLIIGWVFIAVFLIMLEILNRKRKVINEHYKSKKIRNKEN